MKREKALNIRNEVDGILSKINYTRSIPVKIYGVKYMMTEIQVRALQLLAVKRFKISKELFDEYNDNVVIDGNKKPFLETGRFSFSPRSGFYDAVPRIQLDLIRNERGRETCLV